MQQPAVKRSPCCEKAAGEIRRRIDSSSSWVQVARQGNPLFNEGLVAIVDKDLYSRTSPTVDNQLFRKYALNPELAALINALLVPALDPPAITTQRTDIAAIYIPDLIKVDLSTEGVSFAGSGPAHPTNPDDPGFSRLSIFGTPPDLLQSQIPGSVPERRISPRRLAERATFRR